MFESELFGHERGAFTHAVSGRIGLLEEAHTGTLFLDEVGEMALTMQPKLLRFLQDQTITRVGHNKAIHLDVRIVAATNCSLDELRSEGRFREDLYWRLAVIPLTSPPLRSRLEDIPLLLDHFLARFAGHRDNVPPIGEDVYEALILYDWPGNVRELQNLACQLIVLCGGQRIRRCDLPERFQRPKPTPGEHSDPFTAIGTWAPADYAELQARRRYLRKLAQECGRNLEDKFVDAILEQHDGNKLRAAADSGMHRTLIHRNLRARSGRVRP